MQTLFAFVPLLGCAAMMLACAAMMWRGHRSTTRSTDDETAPDDAATNERETVRTGEPVDR